HAEVDFPHVVLKGFAGVEEYVPNPEARVQYDLDLYSPEAPDAARDALIALGYRGEDRSSETTDHLPPFRRESGWRWRGDFFDPDMPVAIELHFRLWDEATEGFVVPGLERFWSRRSHQLLAPPDALAYKSLHLLRHLLRGEVRAAHIYEIAWFLHQHALDE